MVVNSAGATRRRRVRAYWPLWLVLGLAAVVVLCGLSYDFGFKRGLGLQQKTLAELAQLRAESARHADVLSDLEQELINTRQGADIDRQAAEQVREAVVASESKIAALKSELVFYRGLMTPTATEKGLSIRSISFQPAGGANRFRYQIVLQQLAIKHRLLRGTYQIVLRGDLNGRQQALPLRDIAEPGVESAFRFRYFQKIEGILRLPEGFEPGLVEVIAETNEKRPTRVEKQFSWSQNGNS